MPIVAGKEYPYTPEGIAAAKKAARARGEALPGEKISYLETGSGATGVSASGGPASGMAAAVSGNGGPPGSSAAVGFGGQGYGGYLPPGFAASGYPGGMSVHPGVAQRFPGRTIAEKVKIYSQKKAREAAAFAAPHREGQRLAAAAAAATPAAAPASVALADLAGSAALAPSSLDPFLFSPNLSTDENVSVPYNPELGTASVGGAEPTLVQSVLEEPNIFDPQTGFVEPQPTFAHGGAVMPGLGFRPLGYQFGGEVITEFNNLFTANRITEVIDLVNDNPETFFAIDLDPSIAGIVKSLVAQGLVRPPPTAKEITTETETLLPAELNAVPLAASGPGQRIGGTLPTSLGFGPDVEETVTPYMQAGGYVDRGTMAGELGRRGDLSVRQAGETMFERMKRMRGYAHGGYADGYSAPRGTVAGELPRYGDMSVREEGESMGELAKRHQDQDWYNRMGGGLGSLGLRRGVA